MTAPALPPTSVASTLLMGILNVTPDSFSGDGATGPAAIALADRLVAEGVDILDIGAESTRPQGQAVSPELEWERLNPVLSAICRRPWRSKVRVSVDTRHASTAKHALALGVEMINDVAALGAQGMGEVLRASTCDVVVMHALSLPVDPAITLAQDCDVVAEILRWKDEITERALREDIDPHRLLFDPGIGFGKSARQSLDIMHAAPRLVNSGGRWLFGHSRKSFMRMFTIVEASQRDDLTLALSARLAADGVHVIRVHEVARHARLLASLRG
jgi:dihydropteroate synthase